MTMLNDHMAICANTEPVRALLWTTLSLKSTPADERRGRARTMPPTGPHELKTREFADLIARLRPLPDIGNRAVGDLMAFDTQKVRHFSRELLEALSHTRAGLRRIAQRDESDLKSLIDRASQHLRFAVAADRSPWMWDALLNNSPKDRR